MNKLPATVLFFFLQALLPNQASAQQTIIHFLSGTDSDHTVEWDFYCTDGCNSGKWIKIAVPSNWELQGFGTYNYGHDWDDPAKKLGKEHGLYKYRFDVPKEWKGKKINIVFDGAMTDTEVKINSKSAGAVHQGGFNRFKYNISKFLRYGKTNLLEVDVAKHSANQSVNEAERQADFWIFGGIYRPVFLEVLPAVHLERVAIDARADGSFHVLAIPEGAKQGDEVKIALFDLNGKKLVGEFSTSVSKDEKKVDVHGKIEGIASWNPESPTLYDMKISLISHEGISHVVTKRIGFRTVELREHDGFYINGKKVVFKGVDRHSFWPETGRALSDKVHKMDITLMKEMNMNAVRMSHYCPDERFLDLCDSMGLFVLDELTGWQDSYDTIIGPKLIRELILKDENHPSVIIWDHGNEDGWDFANEQWFHVYDIQNRPVIYPWLHRNGVDTYHYNDYDFGISRFYWGNDVFMPTEVLHGLYDGGLGAGLDDFWRRFRANPRAAGAFLWVLTDEAVLRTDMEGTVYDSDGNHGPDGILGPHREKEGSFFTVREVWSPVQVEPVVINLQWDGRLFITNDHAFTNLNECNFEWKLVKTFMPGDEKKEILAEGKIKGPDAAPGETRSIYIETEDHLAEADILEFHAFDRYGHEICDWSWPVQHPKVIVERILHAKQCKKGPLITKLSGSKLKVQTGEMHYVFDLSTGHLQSVTNGLGEVPFGNGPNTEGMEHETKKVIWEKDDNGNLVIKAEGEKFPKYIVWTVHKDGLLELEVAPLWSKVRNIDFVGVSFECPENRVKSMQWLGNGPYRVWKNRRRGMNFNLWEKDYNNTITGQSFSDLIYPEFKGYHAGVNWVRFFNDEGDIDIMIETPNIYLQVFTPETPREVKGGVAPPFPSGDISFLYEIPAIGTKFKQPSQLGPDGQKGMDRYHKGDDNDPIHVWFDFRSVH